MTIKVVKETPNGAALMDNGNVRTPVARVSFPALFRPNKPKDAPPQQEPKYGVALLFKKGEDLSVLKEAVLQVLTKKFGADKNNWPGKIKYPFIDQGTQVEKDGKTIRVGHEAGAYMVRALSKQKPGVVDARNNYIEDEATVYGGCYGRATLRAFWYDQSGNKGVSFGLQNFQKTGDGESFGTGRTKAEDEFAPVEGEDPMSGGQSGDSLADMVG